MLRTPPVDTVIVRSYAGRSDTTVWRIFSFTDGRTWSVDDTDAGKKGVLLDSMEYYCEGYSQGYNFMSDSILGVKSDGNSVAVTVLLITTSDDTRNYYCNSWLTADSILNIDCWNLQFAVFSHAPYYTSPHIVTYYFFVSDGRKVEGVMLNGRPETLREVEKVR